MTTKCPSITRSDRSRMASNGKAPLNPWQNGNSRANIPGNVTLIESRCVDFLLMKIRNKDCAKRVSERKTDEVDEE